MYNCHEDITKFHNDKVNLSRDQQTPIRHRKDANRDKLRNGLQKRRYPNWALIKYQGSYAMRTMVQSSINDYDIDDGVYFKHSDLLNSYGACISPRDARQMVCNAIQDSNLNKAPSNRKNCVRVEYSDGTHVDIPVYRLDDNGRNPELASADNWVRSDARDVTDWFVKQNKAKSPDGTENGGQLRRIVRLAKAFARSRENWKNSILGGFGITVLVCECYHPNSDRDDVSLYCTLREMSRRLKTSTQIKHPVTHGAFIAGSNDPKAQKFRDELGDKFKYLSVLLDDDCDSEDAIKCWNYFFNTKFFNGRCNSGKKYGSGGSTVKRGGTGGYA